MKANEEYLALLHKNATFQMSAWIRDKQFLCLNATEKSEILGFLCNELLTNKAVVNQIEVTVDNVHITRRRKWGLESKIKKLKMLHARSRSFFWLLKKRILFNFNYYSESSSSVPSLASR